MSEINETPKKGNGAFIVIILLLLLSLAVMAYKWSAKNGDLNTCVNENTALKADMEGMNQMMSGYVGNMSNDLKQDFQNMLKTYDELIEKDKSKADSLNLQKEKILGLIKDLDDSKRSGRLNARKIAQMNRENATLRSIMKSYVIQIDSLNTLNVKLTSKLDETTTELSSTQSERDNYKHEAEVNADQVKKGSRLQAFSFSSTGLRMKLNNTTEETNKAKNCIQIRSSFTISENPLTTAGNKTVYMQVIDPDGKTLQSRSSNTVQTDQGSIAYSDKKDIDYQNQRIDLSIFYDLQNNDVIKGNYKVKIYCDGLLIGSDSFTLK
jgi:chromosome segregation ATPase